MLGGTHPDRVGARLRGGTTVCRGPPPVPRWRRPDRAEEWEGEVKVGGGLPLGLLEEGEGFPSVRKCQSFGVLLRKVLVTILYIKKYPSVH